MKRFIEAVGVKQWLEYLSPEERQALARQLLQGSSVSGQPTTPKPPAEGNKTSE